MQARALAGAAFALRLPRSTASLPFHFIRLPW
jgi:hypothetical protein